MAIIHRYFFAAMAGLSAMGAMGCDRKPDTLHIGQIVLATPAEYDKAHTARKNIRAAAQAHMEERGSYTRWDSDAEDAAYRLYITAGDAVLLPNQTIPVRPIQVQIRPIAEDGQEWTVTVATPENAASFDDTVIAGMAQAWAVLRKERQLAAQGEDALRQALQDPDPTLVAFAVTELGRRRSKAAVPELITLMQLGDRPDLTLKTVGSLISIGDERAVPALIELSQRQDPAFVLQMVFAVGNIGGRMAEGYLVTLASGHPDPQVQAGAQDALKELHAASRAHAHSEQ